MILILIRPKWFLLFTVTLQINWVKGITCNKEQGECHEDMNHCCQHGRASIQRYCCAIDETSWVVKIGGVTAAVMLVIILVAVFLTCYKKLRRGHSSARRSSSVNDGIDPDLPPHYSTLSRISRRKASEPEPPEYFKLYPLPAYTPPSREETGECSKQQST
uniref:Uncharacterized LOC100179902 n=1 Tax=Ciona intestinalis TaxID=7719 RepID=F6QCU5_CIOIN|nr:uncharacterized protein LOC100179902 isoform X2 [Ciona intestinalis]|eukprot:XP_002131679.1 uncharacterized protein LOC100179902 isoform X2 [Ciona intestinalis]